MTAPSELGNAFHTFCGQDVHAVCGEQPATRASLLCSTGRVALEVWGSSKSERRFQWHPLQGQDWAGSGPPQPVSSWQVLLHCHLLQMKTTHKMYHWPLTCFQLESFPLTSIILLSLHCYLVKLHRGP